MYQYYTPLRNADGVVVAVNVPDVVYESANNDRANEFEAVKKMVEKKFVPLADDVPQQED